MEWNLLVKPLERENVNVPQVRHLPEKSTGYLIACGVTFAQDERY